jgi:cation transport ATPase
MQKSCQSLAPEFFPPTPTHVGEDLLAVYGLNNFLRPNTKSVVSELQKRDIAVSLINKDDDGAVQKISQ